jgi:hypothetical protein
MDSAPARMTAETRTFYLAGSGILAEASCPRLRQLWPGSEGDISVLEQDRSSDLPPELDRRHMRRTGIEVLQYDLSWPTFRAC